MEKRLKQSFRRRSARATATSSESTVAALLGSDGTLLESQGTEYQQILATLRCANCQQLAESCRCLHKQLTILRNKAAEKSGSRGKDLSAAPLVDLDRCVDQSKRARRDLSCTSTSSSTCSCGNSSACTCTSTSSSSSTSSTSTSSSSSSCSSSTTSGGAGANTVTQITVNGFLANNPNGTPNSGSVTASGAVTFNFFSNGGNIIRITPSA